MAIVKCFFCGKTFDRDKEPFEKVAARRYAHKACYEQQNIAVIQEQRDKDSFYEVVKEIYGKDYNYVLINQQATSYMDKYHYTWSGMAKCLIWFYKINHGSVEEGNGGIGIIPYIYDEVYEYYRKNYETELKNQNIKITHKPVHFNIQSPRAWHRPPHLLDLGGEEDE